jgi:hypothetical protein
MKRASLLLLTAAAGLGALSVSRNVSALGPVDVEVAAKVGGGTNPILVPSNGMGPGAPQLNALGFGLGARAGVSFSGFYGGLSFVDYLGSQGNAGQSMKTVLYGVEAGYNFGVPRFTMRPQLGVGNYTVTQSECARPECEPGSFSTSGLYFEPGLTALVSFGLWIVGADINFLYLWPSGGWNSQPAFTAHGQAGIKF